VVASQQRTAATSRPDLIPERFVGGTVGRPFDALVTDRFDRTKEVVDVVEIAVDACEPHVRDLVNRVQPTQHQFANVLARDFAVATEVKLRLDLLHKQLNSLGTHRPLPARSLDPATDLRPIKSLPALVTFDNPNVELFQPLIGREAAMARTTASPTANEESVLESARIDNAVIVDFAKRTSHAWVFGRLNRQR